MPRSFGREGGDWDDRGNPVLKFILQRSWVLVVPLIAVGWYQAREVAPKVKAIQEDLEQKRAETDQQRTKTLSDARRVEVGISALRALSDTFQVRFDGVDTLIDSVAALRAADLSDLHWLEAQAESLQAIYSEASGKSDELSRLLPPMQQKIDSLRAVIAARDEEVAELEAERKADAELTERVLRPDLFRKNSALFTGEGDYPNRDALPKR
jgi:chromosome segregation ATPase